jgi:hypothetical protein
MDCSIMLTWEIELASYIFSEEATSRKKKTKTQAKQAKDH